MPRLKKFASVALTSAIFISGCASSGDKNAIVPQAGQQQENALFIERTFDAPRALVWKAWTEPKLIKKWWGPIPFTCPVAKSDLKVGGKYLYAMRSPDKKDYWSTGSYLEIAPQEKIVATDSFSDKNGNIVSPSVYGMPADMPRELLMTVTFTDVGSNQTKLTIKQAGMPASMSKMAEAGWTTSLDKFAKALTGIR